MGLNGFRVNLLDGSSNPVLDANGNPITTITANHPTTGDPGYYEFLGLPPGDYQVEFIVVGRDFTTQDADNTGVDGAANSDADPTTGITSVVSLPGGFNPHIDAGVTPLLNSDSACLYGSNELTTIYGKGMGNNSKGQKVVKLNIPDYRNVTDLYAQYAGKTTALRRSGFGS
ncbi:MAG: SdrD B-like domain-containing protein [Chloroflexota bacterium]